MEFVKIWVCDFEEAEDLKAILVLEFLYNEKMFKKNPAFCRKREIEAIRRGKTLVMLVDDETWAMYAGTQIEIQEAQEELEDSPPYVEPGAWIPEMDE